MNLELKHLAPYLGYGIEALDSFDEKNKIIGLKNETYFIENGNTYAYGDIRDCRPILRPISDIEKEIEFKKEKIIPIVELAKIHGMKINGEIFVFSNDTFSEISNDKRQFLQYHFKYKKFEHYGYYKENEVEMFQKLFKWRFDVFGLIEKSLAVSIHDVPQAEA